MAVGMEVVLGMHVGHRLEGWSHVGRFCGTSRLQGNGTDDTRSHHLPREQLWVELTCYWSVFRGRASTLQVSSGLSSMQPLLVTH